MSPLMRKEIRLLLPFFGIAVFLAAVPLWLFPEYSYKAPINRMIFGGFALGMMLLGLAPFGQEFSLGTFSNLLAQPAQRNQIWKTKLLLTAVAAVVVLFVLILSLHLRIDSLLKAVNERLQNDEWKVWNLSVRESLTVSLHSWEFWWIGGVLAVVGLAGGLWTTLLFRQTGAALWFAILVPGVIYLCVEWFTREETTRNMCLVALLGIYSIAGIIWAQRMFLQAQDAQWLGGTVSLLGFTSSEAKSKSVMVRRKKPVAALFRKEFQLQQVSLIVAFGMLVLHVSTLIVRKCYNFGYSSEMRFAFEAVPFLWLLMPLVIGGVAVAEERKLAVMESQMCLPATRRLQFTIKSIVVLFLGVALGGLAPWLVEGLGLLLKVSSELPKPNGVSSVEGFYYSLIILSILAAAFTLVSFFASTLTRNLLHALGATLACGAALSVLFQLINNLINLGDAFSLWKGPLIFIIGAPALALVIGLLSFANYRRLYVDWRMWFRNLLVIAISLVSIGVATAVIYQRPWELFTAREPRHGAARLSGPVQPELAATVYRVFALLPDGRLWGTSNYYWKDMGYEEEVTDSQGTHKQRARVPIPEGGTFIGGSNWVALAAASMKVVALQSDGSLWQVLSTKDLPEKHRTQAWLSLPLEPRQIGLDKNWRTVVANYNSFAALKTDGTLWHWGYVANLGNWDKYVTVQEPVQMGTDSDWAAIFSMGDQMLFMKRGGEIWIQVRTSENRSELKPAGVNGSEWLATAADFSSRRNFLHKDGTLWESSYNMRNPKQVGSDSDWAQIASGMVGLKKSGRLVQPGRVLFSSLNQPSKYSNWLSVHWNWDGMAALAADGTISMWWERGFYGGILGASRDPLWSLNIFDSGNGEAGQ